MRICLYFSDYLLKLIIIGDSGVGKSSLLMRFTVSIILFIINELIFILFRMIILVKTLYQRSVLIS